MDHNAAITNIACGILFLAVSIPLAKKAVGMNRWYGFRFKKSFQSEENWYAVNCYGAKKLIPWSILLILLGILSLFFEGSGKSETVLSLAPLLVFIPVIQSYFFARRL